MTQEEKELLLRDLCARLPYKPKVRYYYHSISSAATNIYSDEGYLSYQNLEDFSIYPRYGLEKKTMVCNILPYLHPMSSMTEEEESEYNLIQGLSHWIVDDGKIVNYADSIDWLNAHHFDYHGLIPIGLALEALEGMYNTKTK